MKQIGSSLIGALDTSPQVPFLSLSVGTGIDSSSLAFGEALTVYNIYHTLIPSRL